MRTLSMGSVGSDVRTLQKALGLREDGIFGIETEKAVKGFQAQNGLVADGVVGARTWEKILKNDSVPIVKSRRRINEIIVHCSATAEGKDYTVSDITKWHKARGFATIGYHYVVYRDGSIHEGRDINSAGAHCTGHNANSIGVCYIGGCGIDARTPKDTRTQAQKTALESLLRKLRSLYPTARIHGHRDFANKACPSFDATKEYANI